MATTIGVVIPNYNYARYLPERIAGIRAQDRPVNALVFLDDASTDESREVAPPLLATLPCPVESHVNARNSGSVLHQWRTGVERLDTDLVWIAEADDRAGPDLVGTLAARLEGDSAALLAFCDSAEIDAAGGCTAPDSKAYLAAAGDDALQRDGVFDTEEALRRILCPRNLMLSASAVLWRRAPLADALARLAEEEADWLCAGDWRVYAEALGGPGTVHYVAKPMNEHRRHGGSVSRSSAAPRRFGEVVAMHAMLRAALGPDPARDEAMRRHLDDLRRAWGLDRGATA